MREPGSPDEQAWLEHVLARLYAEHEEHLPWKDAPHDGHKEELSIPRFGADDYDL